jgi:chemotaxis protein MotA
LLLPIGLLVVLGAVVGGYLMEGGHLAVLYQPAELLIIGGAAVGALLIGTPPKVLREMARQLASASRGGPTRRDYTDLLVMLHDLLNVARRDGVLGLESHVEKPSESGILARHPEFLRNHHALAFLVDTLRLLVSGLSVAAHDLEALMDVDLESHHKEASAPARTLLTIGDALPGLGIVAAVLGIVITMGAIDGPPEEIGHKVGAALVGTFLGILLSYGVAQPLAHNLQAKVEDRAQYTVTIKHVLLAYYKGCHPTIAVEFARRALAADVRPEFTELEQACRSAAKSEAA